MFCQGPQPRVRLFHNFRKPVSLGKDRVIKDMIQHEIKSKKIKVTEPKLMYHVHLTCTYSPRCVECRTFREKAREKSSLCTGWELPHHVLQALISPNFVEAIMSKGNSHLWRCYSMIISFFSYIHLYNVCNILCLPCLCPSPTHPRPKYLLS